MNGEGIFYDGNESFTAIYKDGELIEDQNQLNIFYKLYFFVFYLMYLLKIYILYNYL